MIPQENPMKDECRIMFVFSSGEAVAFSDEMGYTVKAVPQ